MSLSLIRSMLLQDSVAMRSRLRTIFFVSVIPCIPIVFALTYWILTSSCSNQYTSVDVHRLQVDTPLPQKLNRILNNSVKGIVMLGVKYHALVMTQATLYLFFFALNISPKNNSCIYVCVKRQLSFCTRGKEC